MPACPKPRPHALAKADRAKALLVKHWDENHKVRLRSGGRCECVEFVCHGVPDKDGVQHGNWLGPCRKLATDIHHLIGGSGRRNRGKSILAEWKLHVCRKCHAEITQHVLVPVRADADASAIVYERRT